MAAQPSGCDQMLALVGALPDQLEASFAAGATQVEHRGIRRVLVCGMGGSAAAAELVGGILDPARMRIEVLRGYELDASPADGTLLVFSSYSGHTEETLSVWAQAGDLAPNCPRVVLSSGGRLSEEAAAAGVPVLPIPAGLPPRASLGHGVGSLCALLEVVGEPGLAEQVPEAVATLRAGNRRWGLEGPEAPNDRDNQLEELAAALDGRLPLIYSGCRLTHAVARRWRAQINENSKMLVATAELPELDHNEVVGWGQETTVRAQARVICLRDPGEHSRVALRFAATRSVLGLDDERWFERSTGEGPPLARMMALVQEGDVLSCLLARRAGIDPVPVTVIDQLKARLSRS